MAQISLGSSKIVKPGYHIRPKFDLHGLRQRRTGSSKGHIAGELPLTSMIDMFSILVIYLLMNFSTTGEIFFINKNLALPRATKSNPLTTGPLISVVNEGFLLDAPPEYDAGSTVKDNSLALDTIAEKLKLLKQRATDKNMTTDNRVNIQAGEDTPIGSIKRAMTASVSAGWTNINFVVEKRN